MIDEAPRLKPATGTPREPAVPKSSPVRGR